MIRLDMRQALRGLGRPAAYRIVEKSVADHEIIDTTVTTRMIDLVLHPMDARKIAIKPEGERTWKWLDGWTSEKLELGWTLFSEEGARYRIMGSTDWSQAGFYHYEMTERPNPDA